MITTFYPPYNFGGDGIFVHRLSNELARRGHSVDVIHGVNSYRFLAGQEPKADYEDHPNVTVHGIKSRFGFCSPLATQQTGLPLFKSRQIREILDKGFDVIHYHNVSLIGGPKLLEYGKGIKLYTMHDYWLLCPTHLLFRYNRAPCTKRHCFTCELSYKRPPQLWRHFGLLEANLKHVDAFIAASQFTKQIHSPLNLDAPIVHIPHFVPRSPISTTSQAAHPAETVERPYFLFVGRLEKLKGLQTLIPIFRQYLKAQLWVAGTGSYEPHLRKLADGYGNIRFLGYQSANDLSYLYRRAVAVIVPSICFEIFSLVIAEAFMQRTAVIARNVGGMPELIHNNGGLTYSTDEELIRAMDRLLADSSYRDRLGTLGYDTCQLKWSADVHLKRYLSLIHEIAAGQHQRRRRSHLAGSQLQMETGAISDYRPTPEKGSP